MILTIFVRQGDVLRAAVPLSIVLDANAEARGLAIKQAIPRKLDRVGTSLHRPALIANAAKRDEITQADRSSVSQVGELKIALEPAYATLHPLCIQAELDDIGFLAVCVYGRSFACNDPDAGCGFAHPRRHDLRIGFIRDIDKA